MTKTFQPFFINFLIMMMAGCSNEKNSDQTVSDKFETTDTVRTTLPTADFKSGYAEVDGIKMYYEIYGTGKPLVMIHGGGSTIQTSFGRIIPELSKNRQVVAVELQAHGRTSDRNTPISFEQDADDVAGLVKSLDIGKADFLGFSNGGNTTMQIAIRHPQIVNKIIVASAFYKRSAMPQQFWEFMKKGTIADMPQSLKQAFLNVTPDSARLQNLFEKCAKRMIEFKDWNDAQLKSIQAPTLLVTGDSDVASPEHTVQMYRLIPQCQLMVIPGGHGKYMGEISYVNTERNVESFVPLVEEFLEQ